MNRLLIFSIGFLFFSSSSFAGWRSVPVYGKYLPEGEGWRIVGEVSRLTDTESGEFIGFNFYREFRSYFILENHGQPMVEAWDFPLNCEDCPDSKLARVTFVPYLEDKMLGALNGVLDKERNRFQILINDTPLLSIDGETMEIVGGFLKEDLTKMPAMLEDPAVYCSGVTTCIRTLAFGRLGQEDLRPRSMSTVHFRTGGIIFVPNALVYKTPAASFASPIRFSNEKDLVDAVSRYHAPL